MKSKLFLLLFALFFSNALMAQESSQIVDTALKSASSGNELITFRHQLNIIAFLLILSLIPFGIMMLTSFTRISIIFHFLRQALGAPQVPSNQIVIGISLILTGFIMHPVINDIQENAVTPYLNNTLQKSPEVVSGKKTPELVFIEKAWIPLRTFLLQHVREKDLQLFMDISHFQYEPGEQTNLDSIPWYCIVPAFIMSELRLAFMIGFLLFLPFLIIDMVIASVLMSMGMMMLPPILISTPFKLLLFILIDGWRLIIQQIVNGYYI